MEDPTSGISGINYVESYAFATPAMLFALTHWQTHLGDIETKASANNLFGFILGKTLGLAVNVVVVNDDWPAGVVGTHGVAVQVYMGCIVSAEPLVNKFKCIRRALGRKDHRADLLDDDDMPCKGQHMHAQTLCQ